MRRKRQVAASTRDQLVIQQRFTDLDVKLDLVLQAQSIIMEELHLAPRWNQARPAQMSKPLIFDIFDDPDDPQAAVEKVAAEKVSAEKAAAEKAAAEKAPSLKAAAEKAAAVKAVAEKAVAEKAAAEKLVAETAAAEKAAAKKVVAEKAAAEKVPSWAKAFEKRLDALLCDDG